MKFFKKQTRTTESGYTIKDLEGRIRWYEWLKAEARKRYDNPGESWDVRQEAEQTEWECIQRIKQLNQWIDWKRQNNG